MHPSFHPLYVDFCTYFNGNQDYFECHEVLEEYWKSIAPGEKDHPLVGYVQLATGMYHWRRNNTVGAMKILKKAYKNFTANQSSPYFELIGFEELCRDSDISLKAIEKGEPFKAFQIVLKNENLAFLVKQKIEELPPIPKDYLLHKHMLRDRTDILEARNNRKLASSKTPNKKL
ncbi:DUF309 domain-containing protein [Ureibacillus aquaedulcis]|uniref:DUF309 domain-containing protein n=1 Tax=Ureibacillus aquaedulcis TaxID=3058421 RepID=A0ABT8GR62_9BACL|nr:DUF309 domain-containing protein [Ureibacillus sp. BA0131]MDN4493911.1 DUF309 domain-containing protein [Ureibacillus sp. BA0131]